MQKVVLEFEVEVISGNENMFKELNGVIEARNEKKRYVESVNKVIADVHKDMLEKITKRLAGKLNEAEVKSLAVKLHETDTDFGESVVTIQLSKQGLGNLSHVVIYDSFSVKVRSERGEMGEFLLLDEKYELFVRENKSERFVKRKNFREVELDLFKSVKEFLLKRN